MLPMVLRLRVRVCARIAIMVTKKSPRRILGQVHRWMIAVHQILLMLHLVMFLRSVSNKERFQMLHVLGVKI